LSAYFWDGTEEDFPEQVRAMNESAMLSKAMGFAYDVTPVKTEIQREKLLDLHFFLRDGNGLFHKYHLFSKIPCRIRAGDRVSRA
ncbi:hypothetical protein, partial [Faecalibacterium duncaniae]|uniref:hypothetical protein n=1 Tax=Faecalibacterium duncaniae (strain DSM 17677 / JCM 31915 / A2-165) TaxID=411483 RepID=UPI002940FF83